MIPLNFSFNHKNGRYYYDASKIRRTIDEALHIWQKHSTLTFEEIPPEYEADIRISFEPRDHSEIDSFSFRDETLAHAFTPGSGIGGDVHFRDDVHWDFNVLYDEKPKEGQVSFFAVALHEIGHSLGLGHTDDPSAVMYHFYTMNTATLSVDDIRGIQHIYGFPQPQIQSTERTKMEVEVTMPDKCNMTYDAITLIRGELFIFHGKFMWRPDTDADRMFEIRQMWNELPENFDRVDAVFENAKGKILFFIGDEIFIFDGISLIDKFRLYHIGMGWNVKKVDAVFRWAVNNRIYIFSGKNYWRFDEKQNEVEKNYPKLISSTFRDVYNIDTAFNFENQLFFFKDEFFYQFDDSTMRMKRMKPQLSAEKFMKCSMVKFIFFRTNLDDDIQDFIVVEEEPGEDFEHFEKSDLIEISCGTKIKFKFILVILIIFILDRSSLISDLLFIFLI